MTAAELVAGGRQELHGDGGAGLAAGVDQETLAEVAFLQVGKVGKGHAAEGAEGTEGVGVDVGGGVTAFAAQALDVAVGALGKGLLFHIFSSFGIKTTK